MNYTSHNICFQVVKDKCASDKTMDIKNNSRQLVTDCLFPVNPDGTEEKLPSSSVALPRAKPGGSVRGSALPGSRGSLCRHAAHQATTDLRPATTDWTSSISLSLWKLVTADITHLWTITYGWRYKDRKQVSVTRAITISCECWRYGFYYLLWL